MNYQELKKLAQLHDENIELKKEIERLKQHYNIDKLEKAAENYANNWFNMHDTNYYKALRQGFEAGSLWQSNQISPAIKTCELEIERLKAEREWISVKDRLPENNVDVIVRMEGGSVDTDYLTSANEFDFYGRFVMYWMPLPKEPKQ